MASRTKGITIEINGDVTKLDDSLKEVNKSLGEAGRGLKDVDRLLKLDPSNVDLLKQKQEYLNTSIESTKEKLQREKEALEQMLRQKKPGDLCFVCGSLYLVGIVEDLTVI